MAEIKLLTVVYEQEEHLHERGCVEGKMFMDVLYQSLSEIHV